MMEPRSSFCGKNKAEVQRLIEGAENAYICDECVLLGAEILSEEGLTGSPAARTAPPTTPTPAPAAAPYRSPGHPAAPMPAAAPRGEIPSQLIELTFAPLLASSRTTSGKPRWVLGLGFRV
jgi:hypothetical protein